MNCASRFSSRPRPPKCSASYQARPVVAPVFQTMLANPTRICEAKFATLYLRDTDAFRACRDVEEDSCGIDKYSGGAKESPLTESVALRFDEIEFSCRGEKVIVRRGGPVIARRRRPVALRTLTPCIVAQPMTKPWPWLLIFRSDIRQCKTNVRPPAR